MPSRTWADAEVRWSEETTHKKVHARDLIMILWLTQFFGQLSLHAINEEHIEEVIDTKRDEGVKESTINRHMALIRSIFRAAMNKRRWSHNMPYIPKFKEMERRERYLNRAQSDRLKAALPAHYQNPMVFSLSTGIRHHRSYWHAGTRST